MTNHIVIDVPSSSIACCHCAVVETLPQPIPEHALQAWINSFEEIHAACVKPDTLPPLLLPRALPMGFNPVTAPRGLEDWLRKGDRGISSETIVSHLTGLVLLAPADWSHPKSPDDLNRCENLLHSVPTLRPRMSDMANVSLPWARIVAEWDGLVAQMQLELRQALRQCPKTAERLATLADEGLWRVFDIVPDN